MWNLFKVRHCSQTINNDEPDPLFIIPTESKINISMIEEIDILSNKQQFITLRFQACVLLQMTGSSMFFLGEERVRGRRSTYVCM